MEEAAEDGGGGGGGNFIVIVPGANYLLSPEHVAEATDRLKGANVIMVINNQQCHGQKVQLLLVVNQIGRFFGGGGGVRTGGGVGNFLLGGLSEFHMTWQPAP